MKLTIISMFFRTLISYTIIALTFLFLFWPCFLIIFLPKKYRYNNRVYFALAHTIYKISVWSLGLPVIIRGRENIPNYSAIFVANHQSSIDIPVVGMLCNRFPHGWLVLAEYAHHIILGPFVRRMNIVVNKDTPIKAARSLINAINFAKEYRNHIIIFPEGGRFVDGKIHEFFEGFALLAQKTERPVVPIYMPNNGKIYPPFGFFVHYYPIEVIIGKPFVFNPEEDTDALFTEKVHNWFLEQSRLKNKERDV